MDGSCFLFKILLAFGIVFKSWGNEMWSEGVDIWVFDVLIWWIGWRDLFNWLSWVNVEKLREEDHQVIHNVPLCVSPNPFHPVLKHGSRSASIKKEK